MSYVLKYRRKWFWKSHKVTGHGYNEKQDKLVIDLVGGGVMEIAHWSDCEIKLGMDWMLEQKRRMEEKAGQSIPLNV